MPYDAVTIDSSIFIQLGLNLETGLLAQLAQFRDGPTDLILSEIVEREILKHLTQNGKKARDRAIGALDAVEQLLLAEGEDLFRVKAAAAAIGDSRVVARKRLAKFVETTGSETIDASLCSTDDVLKLYFGGGQPFEASGAKKSEFPDAIALLSLQKWAEAAGKTILAVSGDKGWEEFANTSAQIDVEKDLAKALEIVQEHAEAAEAGVAKFLAAVEAGEVPDQTTDLVAMLGSSMEDWGFVVEANSAYYFESENWPLTLNGYAFLKDGDAYDITIVRVGTDVVVARIGATFNVTAKVDFSLSTWDSEDREYVGLGGTSALRQEEFEGAFLLTLAGNLDGDLDDIGVVEAEVVEAIGEVDFGEIEMDRSFWDDDGDYEAYLSQEAESEANAVVDLFGEPPAPAEPAPDAV